MTVSCGFNEFALRLLVEVSPHRKKLIGFFKPQWELAPNGVLAQYQLTGEWNLNKLRFES